VEDFIKEYSWAVMLIILITEYLIGSSKLKSNSSIELGLRFLKLVFRIKDKPDLKIVK